MNEKIKELAEQARVKDPVFTLDLDILKLNNEQATKYNSETGEFEPLFTNYIDFEKFAELIVAECISMADDFECDVNQRGLVDRMKQHFGVK